MASSSELQRQTLRLYGELVCRREHWGGRLVFTSGPGCSATGLAAAVSIAGGCTLVLDPDDTAVKAVFRQGGVDFVVSTLDEALRVLKNELRKQTPLGVVLIAPVEATLAEMAERGVAPDLNFELASPTPELTSWLEARGWSEAVVNASPELLASLPADDTIRRRWLQRIAQYQRVGAERVVWQ